jgi:hypothetical protein
MRDFVHWPKEVPLFDEDEFLNEDGSDFPVREHVVWGKIREVFKDPVVASTVFMFFDSEMAKPRVKGGITHWMVALDADRCSKLWADTMRELGYIHEEWDYR